MSIVPLTALIDTSLADKGDGQTSLLDGYHYYGTEANTLEYGLKIESPIVSRYRVDTSSTTTASTISLIGDQSLIDDFDPSLPDGSVDVDNNGVPHPRYPRLSESIYDNKFLFPSHDPAGHRFISSSPSSCCLSSKMVDILNRSKPAEMLALV